MIIIGIPHPYSIKKEAKYVPHSQIHIIFFPTVRLHTKFSQLLIYGFLWNFLWLLCIY